MKNDLDLFEDREKDWLAKEIRRDNLLVLFIFLVMTIVFIFMTLARGYF